MEETQTTIVVLANPRLHYILGIESYDENVSRRPTQSQKYFTISNSRIFKKRNRLIEYPNITSKRKKMQNQFPHATELHRLFQ